MPSSTPIPDEAVEALKGFVLRHGPYSGELSEMAVERSASDAYLRAESTQALEAAYPHLLSVFRERLLGDEAVEAVARALDPDCFEKATGFGHQEFAEDDREARGVAREKARKAVAALSEVMG